MFTWKMSDLFHYCLKERKRTIQNSPIITSQSNWEKIKTVFQNLRDSNFTTEQI